jgi:hypothetical protein
MPATLSSNSGEAQFVVELGAPAEYATNAGFESSIHIRGQCWGRDHPFPFSASVGGLWLRSADLAALRDHIARWTALPLDRLDAGSLIADFELASLPGQSVYVCFGPRPDTISHLNPVISIVFSVDALYGEYHFVTDQSCLSLFAQELSEALAG